MKLQFGNVMMTHATHIDMKSSESFWNWLLVVGLLVVGALVVGSLVVVTHTSKHKETIVGGRKLTQQLR